MTCRTLANFGDNRQMSAEFGIEAQRRRRKQAAFYTS
jgi:hypothetical protein